MKIFKLVVVTLVFKTSQSIIFLIITPLPLSLTISITPSPIIQHLDFGGVNTTALRELGGFGATGGLVVMAVFFTVVGLFGIEVTAVAGFV